MKHNIPEVGDLVRINHQALEELKTYKCSTNRWWETFSEQKVIEIKKNTLWGYDVRFSYDSPYPPHIIAIDEQGTVISQNDYKTVFFQLASEKTSIKSDFYCSCSGSTITNTVLGQTFKVCTVCKKEQL